MSIGNPIDYIFDTENYNSEILLKSQIKYLPNDIINEIKQEINI